MSIPYAAVGPKLCELGYSAIPIRPGTKCPGKHVGGEWRNMDSWTRYCIERTPTIYEYARWAEWPDAGVGLACGKIIGLDHDTDDPKLLAALERIIPSSPVRKRGARGFTTFFFHASGEIASRKFKIGDKIVFETLVNGRQTVIPPSVHPDTGIPYHWVTFQNLLHFAPHELPELSDNICERIDEVLEPFKKAAEPLALPPRDFSKFPSRSTRDSQASEKKQENLQASDKLEENTVWSDLNAKALANFPAWVPDLKLPKTQALNGGARYKAVADWRPSGSGRAMDKRSPNLGFDPSGIKDFGTDTSYSPLDAVHHTLGGTFDEAFAWLQERVDPQLKPVTLQGASIENSLHNAAQALNEQLTDLRSETPVGEPLPGNAPAPGPQPEPLKHTHKTGHGGTPASETKEQNEFEPEPEPAPTIDGAGADLAIAYPDSVINCPGLVGDISKWITNSAPMPMPSFSILAALTYCAALFGRRYVSPTGLGPNLYTVALARNSFGKEHPLQCLKLLDREAGTDIVGDEDFSSMAAVEQIIMERPSIVLPIDEVGFLFKNINSLRAGNWESQIRGFLLKIYSKSGGIYTVKRRAGEAQKTVFYPCLSLCGCSTPQVFFDGLGEESLTDGMLARLLICYISERPETRILDDDQEYLRHKMPPENIVSQIKHIVELTGSPGNLNGVTTAAMAGLEPALKQVIWDNGEALKALQELIRRQNREMDTYPEYDGLVGRNAARAQQIAMIIAIGIDPVAPRITTEYLEIGACLVSISCAMTKMAIIRHMSGSAFERNWKTVLEIIKGTKNEGITDAKLYRRKGVGRLEPREFEACMKYLTTTEMVTLPLKVATKGRPTCRRYAVEFAPNMVVQNA